MTENKPHPAIGFIRSWLETAKVLEEDEGLDDKTADVLESICQILAVQVAEYERAREEHRSTYLNQILGMTHAITRLHSCSALSARVCQEPFGLREKQLAVSKHIQVLGNAVFAEGENESDETPTTMRSVMGAFSPSAYD